MKENQLVYYELYEAIKLLKENKTLVFKRVFINEKGVIVDSNLANDFYLVAEKYLSSYHIRCLQFHDKDFLRYYEGIFFGEKDKWIISKDISFS